MVVVLWCSTCVCCRRLFWESLLGAGLWGLGEVDEVATAFQEAL